MNQIKLQNLTPDIYYNQSRDFQFIGRLYDTVLNSIKTNSELLYNLQLSDNSDERLIDLMTMTLGFKSRHNYNVKQLTSLCSAFTTIIKNKGNINSIILAVRALLNAEGIEEDLAYSYDEKHTTINLFISQNLTDINLLKDLLIYILPAGMGCNIIKEFRITKEATTELTSSDAITVYEGGYDVNNSIEPLSVNSAAKSIIPTATEYGITNALAKSYPGLLANSDIYRPQFDSEGNSELYYNITYITNGAKIIDQYTIEGATYTTPYSYKVGLNGETSIKLPTAIESGYKFEGWFTDSKFSTRVIEIINTDTGNKVFYGKITINVSFDMQGHGTQIAGQALIAGNVITKPTSPIEEGYVFGGWYKEQACSNEWDFSTVLTEDMLPLTLYAKWTNK